MDQRQWDIKRMIGQSAYRLRIGQYRAVFTLDDERMILGVLKIGVRGDIYR